MLTQRQKMILAAIVEDYVRYAEPVGSRTLSKHRGFQISPATIRNEMADLEDLGYLDQPHTSAGRIPSQKGYRFYVDHLATDSEVDPETIVALRALFQEQMSEVERVIQQTTTVISQLTQYTTLVLGPKIHQEKIKHIQLIPLSHGTAVAILVTDAGHVENRQVHLSEDISSDAVARMVNLLNSKLQGTPLANLRSHLYREVATEMANTLEYFEDAIAVLDELATVTDRNPGKVYVGGAANMLTQPEFRDVDKVRPLLEWLEQADWYTAEHALPVAGSKLQVRIGQENEVEPLRDCSVVSATYSIGGVPVGNIGVIGPTRMNYRRVMHILDYVASALSNVITERLSGGSW
ncbi:heat-inducible transcription repressor HrcA [Alicyclobacillus contaminans]|uniref:heat-inducible transcriptional repressor HrcA n=1 Tax=Alicyclobacillus contaminans TaxID=392016 RepID=UPI0003FD3726|nr:heat-inducible transcriptional repressor HrcA [Alicyclobacillus contaminans]GMA52143.1 heat-inducible transcription repressor HrcA [Alicyclobacillus contaminans]